METQKKLGKWVLFLPVEICRACYKYISFQHFFLPCTRISSRFTWHGVSENQKQKGVINLHSLKPYSRAAVIQNNWDWLYFPETQNNRPTWQSTKAAYCTPFFFPAWFMAKTLCSLRILDNILSQGPLCKDGKTQPGTCWFSARVFTGFPAMKPTKCSAQEDAAS